ncbi:MAG: hypothetical protein ACXVLT_03830 [Flavisolibacter sp.]
MKKIFFCTGLFVVISSKTHAQCDAMTKFTSSKTEYLNSNNEVKNTHDERTVINISKSEITILPEGTEEHKLTGIIKSFTCNWSVPFQEGQTIVKARMTDERGDVKNATLTIEGKQGKITLWVEAEEMPDLKIRMTADSYEGTKS